MRRRQPVRASVLALAVTLAGIACACAIPALDVGAAEPTAHHASHGTPAKAECAHADCHGDCGIDALVPDRDGSLELPKTQFDGGAIAASWPATVLPTQILSRHSPPTRPWRAADTPIRRFDILLN